MDSVENDENTSDYEYKKGMVLKDSNMFETLLRKILGKIVDNDVIKNIVNIFNNLPDETKNEIQLRFGENMIFELNKANEKIKSLTNQMNSIAKEEWTQLLGNIAKLQGLLILKRVKKIKDDPSQDAKNFLIKEIVDAFNAKIETVNDILLSDLNLSSNKTDEYDGTIVVKTSEKGKEMK
jgi:hypothetical protein